MKLVRALYYGAHDRFDPFLKFIQEIIGKHLVG
jgi:hypothetical protein